MATATVNVKEVEQPPTLFAPSTVMGNENSAFPLHITVTPNPADGNDPISITIQGLGTATLSDNAGSLAAYSNGSGSYTLSPSQLAGLVISPGLFEGTLNLSITATATAQSPQSGSATASAATTVTVDGVPYTPNLSAPTTFDHTSANSTYTIPLSALGITATPGSTDPGNAADTISFNLVLPAGVSLVDASGNSVSLNNVDLATDSLKSGVSQFSIEVSAVSTAAVGGAPSAPATATITIHNTEQVANGSAYVPDGGTITVGGDSAVFGGGGNTIIIGSHGNPISGVGVEVARGGSDFKVLATSVSDLNINGGTIVTNVNGAVILGNTLDLSGFQNPNETIVQLPGVAANGTIPQGDIFSIDPQITGGTETHIGTITNISTVIGAGTLIANAPYQTLDAYNIFVPQGLITSFIVGVQGLNILDNNSLPGITDGIGVNQNPTTSSGQTVEIDLINGFNANSLSQEQINLADFPDVLSYKDLNISLLGPGTLPDIGITMNTTPSPNVTIFVSGVDPVVNGTQAPATSVLTPPMFVFADSPTIDIANPVINQTTPANVSISSGIATLEPTTAVIPLGITVSQSNLATPGSTTMVEISVPNGVHVVDINPTTGVQTDISSLVNNGYDLTLQQAADAAVSIPAGGSVPVGVSAVTYLGVDTTNPVYSADSGSNLQITDTAQVQVTASNTTYDAPSTNGYPVDFQVIGSESSITNDTINGSPGVNNVLDLSQVTDPNGLVIALPEANGQNGTAEIALALTQVVNFTNINHVIAPGSDTLIADANGQILEDINNPTVTSSTNTLFNMHNFLTIGINDTTVKLDPGTTGSTAVQTDLVDGFNSTDTIDLSNYTDIVSSADIHISATTYNSQASTLITSTHPGDNFQIILAGYAFSSTSEFTDSLLGQIVFHHT